MSAFATGPRGIRKRRSGRPPSHGVTMRQEDTHTVCGRGPRGASMDKVCIIGLDISKRSFQVHGATAGGAPVVRRKLTRAKVLEFLASQPRCLVVMETCGGAHHWGREIQQLGHEVRLIAPIYVKAFAKRQKRDARDAAAIVEAAQRPTMRFVAVKTQAGPGPFDGVPNARAAGSPAHPDGQRDPRSRGHLAEFGLVAPRGVANIEQLWEAFTECAESLPELVVSTTAVLFERVDEIDKQMRMLVRENEELRRLTTIPGVGEVTALAVHAFAPSMDSFTRGRDFAAWIGLTPWEISIGGRQRLGRITKIGQRNMRQLLVLGATSVSRHARRRKEITDPWLRRMLAAYSGEAGRGGAGEQDGAHHLGADGHRRELPCAEGTRCGRGIGTVGHEHHEHGASRHASAMVPSGCAQDGERSRGKRSVRQGRKNQLRAAETWSSHKRFGSDLTKTIRTRGRQGMHREAGHTSVPDPHAALRSKSCLPTKGASTYAAGSTSAHGRASLSVPVRKTDRPGWYSNRLGPSGGSVCAVAGSSASTVDRIALDLAGLQPSSPKAAISICSPACGWRGSWC